MSESDKDVTSEIAIVSTDVKYLIREIDSVKQTIVREIDSVKQTLANQYITRQEFEPIKKLCYGFVSIILMGVIGAILMLILRK